MARLIKAIAIWLALYLALASRAVAQTDELPDGLTAAILVKVLEFEQECCKNEDLRIHVVDDARLAESLQELVGKNIKQGKLFQGYSWLFASEIWCRRAAV